MSKTRRAGETASSGQVHQLVDDTLYVEDYRLASGRTATGIIGRCACGWDTGHRFSPGLASIAFRGHLEANGIEEAA